MLIGAMNHPAEDVYAEIRWMADLGLDFIDLTLEPPRASAHDIDVPRLRDALAAADMPAVGHTAYYLPLAGAYESIRRAAVAEARTCLEVFAALGVEWMNLHPDRHVPMHGRDYLTRRNLESLRELTAIAADLGVGLMLENLPGDWNSAAQLAELLDPVPELGLHLDIGHSNLRTPRNTADEIIRQFGPRIRHVHLHDNKGGDADLHMPLGTGSVDYVRHVRALKAVGYDATITLEVFTPDRRHLMFSREVLRAVWDAAPGPVPPAPPTATAPTLWHGGRTGETR